MALITLFQRKSDPFMDDIRYPSAPRCNRKILLRIKRLTLHLYSGKEVKLTCEPEGFGFLPINDMSQLAFRQPLTERGIVVFFLDVLPPTEWGQLHRMPSSGVAFDEQDFFPAIESRSVLALPA
jgi:hypothetical protein